jgi:phosphohistidine phosphatase
MAETLWLLRHGEAEDHAATDFARRLTPRGQGQARCAGRALARLGVEFARAFTSPRVRALDTARLACAELGLEPVEHAPLGETFEARDALELIAGLAGGGSILLVGHEPDLSRLVATLTGARIAMKKGGLAAIRLGGGQGELVALLRPREIELVAGR